MKEFTICTDSCADLSPEMQKELDVKVINMHIVLNNEEYLCAEDEGGLQFRAFYKLLRQGATASTGQISPMEFMEMFTPMLADGKDILYIGFSSALSSTINAARLAANELVGSLPGSKVRVVDSLSASMGQGLLVWYAAMMRKRGKSLDETANWVEANKLRLRHLFTVDDLNFLRRGGRLSGAKAFVGTVLSMKPLLHIDDSGRILVIDTIRGRRKSLINMAENLGESACDPQSQTIFISHGDCLEDAQFLANEIKRRFGVREIFINVISPVIGSHSGPGTVALFFLTPARNMETSGQKKVYR